MDQDTKGRDAGKAPVPGADDVPVVEMVEPMLGFPEHRQFALTRLDESGLLCDLRSLDDPDLRFVVVPPSLFFDDYAPELSDATATALGLTDTDDAVTLVVVNLGGSLAEATANLLAPVVMNPARRVAAQVVLDDAGLSLRAPLVPRV